MSPPRRPRTAEATGRVFPGHCRGLSGRLPRTHGRVAAAVSPRRYWVGADRRRSPRPAPHRPDRPPRTDRTADLPGDARAERVDGSAAPAGPLQRRGGDHAGIGGRRSVVPAGGRHRTHAGAAVDPRRRLRDWHGATGRPAVPPVQQKARDHRRVGGIPPGAGTSVSRSIGRLLRGADLAGRPAGGGPRPGGPGRGQRRRRPGRGAGAVGAGPRRGHPGVAAAGLPDAR